MEGEKKARVKRKTRESRVTHRGLRRGSAWETLRMASSQVKSLYLSDFNHDFGLYTRRKEVWQVLICKHFSRDHFMP